jgi:DNA polymerase-3 subunit alpha
MEKDIRRFSTHSAADVAQLPADKEVRIGGLLTQLRFMNTKKARNGNSRYLRCKVEDMTGNVECVMWPDDFVRYKDKVSDDQPLFVVGTVDRNMSEPLLVLSRLLTREEAQREFAKGLYLLVKLGQHQPRDIDNITYLLKQKPGNCPVYLTLRDQAKRDCVLRLGRELQINPADYLHEELEALLGEGSVKLM